MMKHCLITILLIALTTSCIAQKTESDWDKRYETLKAQELKNFKPPEVGDLVHIMLFKGNPFTGYMTAYTPESITIGDNLFMKHWLNRDSKRKYWAEDHAKSKAYMLVKEEKKAASGEPEKAEVEIKNLQGDFVGQILATGQGRILLLDSEGEIIWKFKGENCSDVWMLENGNVLFADNNVKEVNRKTNKIVWQYKPKEQKGGGAFSCQRLDNGNTLVGENSAGRIVEVDKEGKVVFELKLPLCEPGSHNNLRMVRKTKKGNYLVCHKDKKMVREYSPEGDVLFEVTTPDIAFSAVRLPSGNTIIGHISGITEYDSDGWSVWKFGKEHMRELDIGKICGIHALPDNSMACGIYQAYTTDIGACLVGISPKKKHAWHYINPKDLDKNMMSIQVLDSTGSPLSDHPLR